MQRRFARALRTVSSFPRTKKSSYGGTSVPRSPSSWSSRRAKRDISQCSASHQLRDRDTKPTIRDNRSSTEGLAGCISAIGGSKVKMLSILPDVKAQATLSRFVAFELPSHVKCGAASTSRYVLHMHLHRSRLCLLFGPLQGTWLTK